MRLLRNDPKFNQAAEQKKNHFPNNRLAGQKCHSGESGRFQKPQVTLCDVELKIINLPSGTQCAVQIAKKRLKNFSIIY